MRDRKWAAAAAVVVAMISFDAAAATGPRVGPKESWSEMQKYEYHIGQLSAALGMCSHFDLSTRLKALADLTPYGRQGWQSLQAFDDIRGARCGSYADSAKDILEDADKLRHYLSEQYGCSGSGCAGEEGDEASNAACRPEVDDYLASLAIKQDDIQNVRVVSRVPGANNRFNGNASHHAWVRLASCSGWLIIELTKGCYPQQSFTRGDCAIEGVSSY